MGPEIGTSSIAQEDVRILLLGQPGVGKTSLIFSLVNDEFDSEVPARLVDIIIPPGVTSENVQTHIVDYSSREQSETELDDAIQDANVVCLVYDASDHRSLAVSVDKWIPRIHQTSQGNKAPSYKPIILVANKIDLCETKPLDIVNAIVHAHKEIEFFIETSALLQKNIVELFFAAQKTLLYPLSPLFDSVKRTLTQRCREALTSIFKKCDMDCDDLLNDDELNAFQEANFEAPLERESLEEIKTIIKQSTNDGIRNNSMTLAGFLIIHMLSINKGQHQFTWQVLRKYGYDNELNLESVANSSFDIDNQSTAIISDSFASRVLEADGDNNVHGYDDDIDSESLDRFEDISWIRDRFGIITFYLSDVRIGASMAVATFLGAMFLRYLMRNSNRAITNY